MKIGLVEILKVAGFDPSIPTKLVRHKDSRCSMEDLRHERWKGQTWLDLYQGYQKNPVFDKVKQVVSFYGMSGTSAGFYGVYKVIDRIPASDGPELPPSQEWGQGCRFFYRLERDPQFDDFRDRLVIEWGKGTINWHQKLNDQSDKEVLEILAPGRKLPPFVDYLEFSLPHDQLKDLFMHADAHRDWRIPLSSVAGVYLVLAETTGDMYVGSAYGVDGIWGRWQKYANSSGHGDNVLLESLIERDPNYPSNFRFSVLQILPKSTAPDDVLRWEKLYKRKLGTRATGLNLN